MPLLITRLLSRLSLNFRVRKQQAHYNYYNHYYNHQTVAKFQHLFVFFLFIRRRCRQMQVTLYTTANK
jgi:hypothetical protein